ncbi:MAG: threonylcarbamoyl-AMP synthase [Dehalococcoidia bacterium]|nr:threonylcarbamoyl-AMP synthase [Dehalococcoidia bacterium]
MVERRRRRVPRHELGVDARLAYPARDQHRVLRAVIDHHDRFWGVGGRVERAAGLARLRDLEVGRYLPVVGNANAARCRRSLGRVDHGALGSGGNRQVRIVSAGYSAVNEADSASGARIPPPAREAERVPILSPAALDEVARALRAGAVCGVPTDTVYGLAASLDHQDAVRRLAVLKGREATQPIALLIDSIEAVALQLAEPAALERVRRFWPGALTAVVRVRPGFAGAVATADGTVGLRQPDGALLRALLRACGGMLAVTSANRHGEPPATTAEGVIAAFGDSLLVLDGGERTGGVASTVVDLTTDPPRLLREGPVSAEALGLGSPATRGGAERL